MKNKTHTYNIIKKHGKGNIKGSIYTIEYQVDNLPQRYMSDMYCLGSENRIGKFAWLESQNYPFIVTHQDKDNFIKELALYQKGSSYRKNNPIKYSDIEVLQDKRNKLYEQLNEIDKDIATKIRQDQQEKLTKYRSSVSKKSKKLLNEVCDILNNDIYEIIPVCDVYVDCRFYDGMYLVDKKTEKIIGMFIYDKIKHMYKIVDVPDKLLLKLI